MTYAKGKYALFISDRSGLQFPYTEMVTEWNGAKVHTSEYEKKAPQIQPQIHMPDPEALQWARPARTAPPTTNLLPLNAFRHEPGLPTVFKVFEPGHGRTTGDTVRFRDVQDGKFSLDLNKDSGFTITVIDENFYKIPSDVGFTGSGPIIGGGGQAFAGPVTLSA